MRAYLFELGMKHCLFLGPHGRIQPLQWDHIGDSMVKTMAQVLVSGSSPHRHEQLSAFRVFVHWMMSIMRDGFFAGQLALKVSA